MILVILVIGLAIYACFSPSALLAWFACSSWGLMGGYLGLLLVQSYTWLICHTRHLASGTAIGLEAGWGRGLGDGGGVAVGAGGPAVDPLPALDPEGTLVSSQMQRLNG